MSDVILCLWIAIKFLTPRKRVETLLSRFYFPFSMPLPSCNTRVIFTIIWKKKKVKVVLNFVFLKIKWSVPIWQPSLTLLKIWLTPINRLIVFNKFIGSNSTYSRIQVGLSTLRSVKIDRFGFSAHKILRFNGIHKKSLPTLTYHRLYIPWF